MVRTLKYDSINQRQMRLRSYEFCTSFLDYKSIVEVVNQIKEDEEKKSGYTLYDSNFHLEVGDNYGDPEIELVYETPETDEEYNARLEHDLRMKKAHEEREREQYEKLKKKFGG